MVLRNVATAQEHDGDDSRKAPSNHDAPHNPRWRDARALAEACVLGAYRPAHRLSDAHRHVRGRLGVRDALVRPRTRYIALIRALLRQHGYRPSGSAEGFIQRVRDLSR